MPPGGGEVAGDSSAEKRIEILCDRDELHATWTRMGRRRDGASPHVHRTHSDLFYVLEGELAVTVGDDLSEIAAPAGTLVLAPPLLVHGFRNATDAEACYLNFHAPGGGFADYLRGNTPGFDSEDPPADGGRPVEDAIVARAEGDREVAVLADVDEIRVTEVRGSGVEPSPGHLTCIYVLEGALTIEVGGPELRAEAGAWVRIPPGLEHSVSAGGARFLEIRA